MPFLLMRTICNESGWDLHTWTAATAVSDLRNTHRTQEVGIPLTIAQVLCLEMQGDRTLCLHAQNHWNKSESKAIEMIMPRCRLQAEAGDDVTCNNKTFASPYIPRSGLRLLLLHAIIPWMPQHVSAILGITIPTLFYLLLFYYVGIIYISVTIGRLGFLHNLPCLYTTSHIQVVGMINMVARGCGGVKKQCRHSKIDLNVL